MHRTNDCIVSILSFSYHELFYGQNKLIGKHSRLFLFWLVYVLCRKLLEQMCVFWNFDSPKYFVFFLAGGNTSAFLSARQN